MGVSSLDRSTAYERFATPPPVLARAGLSDLNCLESPVSSKGFQSASPHFPPASHRRRSSYRSMSFGLRPRTAERAVDEHRPAPFVGECVVV